MAQTNAMKVASLLAQYQNTAVTGLNYVTDNTDVDTAITELDSAIQTLSASVVTTIGGLSDVTLTSASDGQFLVYDSGGFINQDLTAGVVDVSFTGSNYMDASSTVEAALSALDAAAAGNANVVASFEQVVLGATPTSFTIGTSGRTAENILVQRNGSVLAPGASNDYTLSGTTVTFNGALSPAPAQNDVINVHYLPL